MKIMPVILAAFLMLGSALGQISKGSNVYTKSTISDNSEGKFLYKAPGASAQVLEVWPSHVVAIFEDGYKTEIDKTNVSMTPLTEVEIAAAVKARAQLLPSLIADQKALIASQEKLISDRSMKGTLHRKIADSRKVGGGEVIKFAHSKEETDLEGLRAGLKTLVKEQQILSESDPEKVARK